VNELRISADCHLLEPPDLFVSRLPAGLRERAARVQVDDDYMHFIIPGAGTETLSLYRDTQSHVVTHGDMSLEQRQKHLMADGVWGELIHPNLGSFAFVPDGEMAFAQARVYNDYLIEFFGGHLGRHKPTALIPLNDPDQAVAEIERVAGMGLEGLMFPAVSPIRYASPALDRVWAAAQANGMVACFHVGGGTHGQPADEKMARLMTRISGGEGYEAAAVHANRLRAETQGSVVAQQNLADLIGTGVLERYPDLHFIAVEFNAYWLAGFMAGMDKAYTLGIGQDVAAPYAHSGVYDPGRAPDDQPTMFLRFALNDKWPYPLRPSDYVRRQVHLTFMDDPGAIALRHYTGVEAIVWGSDYPHHEATWPRSEDALEKQFAGVPDEDRKAMTGGTISKLFKFEIPAAV